jgi:hypothetical protein
MRAGSGPDYADSETGKVNGGNSARPAFDAKGSHFGDVLLLDHTFLKKQGCALHLPEIAY